MSTPYAAATDSRFISAEISGTTTDRNAIRSRMMLSAITTAITSGSFSLMREARSMYEAVWPPT